MTPEQIAKELAQMEARCRELEQNFKRGDLDSEAFGRCADRLQSAGDALMRAHIGFNVWLEIPGADAAQERTE